MVTFPIMVFRTVISAKTSRFVPNFTSDKRSEVGELFSGPSGLLPEMSDGPATIREHCLHILGAGEKSLPQETKCSIGFSANIADMRIPFQIICNCYTKVFDIIHIFENCTF